MLPRHDDKGAEAEWEKSGGPCKGAFGKEDEHPPSLGSIKGLVHVLDASFGISTIDKQGPQLPQEGGKELRLKFLLGNEGFPRDNRRENQSVEIARAVVYNNEPVRFRPSAGHV